MNISNDNFTIVSYQTNGARVYFSVFPQKTELLTNGQKCTYQIDRKDNLGNDVILMTFLFLENNKTEILDNQEDEQLVKAMISHISKLGNSIKKP